MGNDQRQIARITQLVTVGVGLGFVRNVDTIVAAIIDTILVGVDPEQVVVLISDVGTQASVTGS